MLSKEKSLEWLRRRTKEYHSCKNGTSDLVDELEQEGKLGQGFSSLDRLEEVDIGDGSTPRSTYVNANL
jgi:hypothetical protein